MKFFTNLHMPFHASYLIEIRQIFSSFFRADGSNLLLDPYLICKKSRRLRDKYSDMCKNETFLMREISRGINMGFRECEHQFKHHRWNCTSIARSMRKILLKGIIIFFSIHFISRLYSVLTTSLIVSFREN